MTDQPSQPAWLPVKREMIPAELRAIPRWVLWRGVWKPDKGWNKEPFRVADYRHRASSTDPATWGTFDDALDVYSLGDVDGVGFVLIADDSIVGVDLDHVVDPTTGVVKPDAQAIVDALGSYTELSPSSTGLRIICHGALTPGGRRKVGDIEAYATGRYLTMTGHHLAGTPITIESRDAEVLAFESRYLTRRAQTPPKPQTAPSSITLDDKELVERAQRAGNGEKFSQLWQGDTRGYPSPSEADQALCCILAFWTGRDAACIDRLFRASGLYRREKWDSKRGAGTYGADTIRAAIELTADVYEGTSHVNGAPGATPPDATSAAPEAEQHQAGDDELGGTLWHGFRTYSWAELTSKPAAPPRYHWRGWTPEAGVTVIVAPGETAKSFFALYVASMTAAGRSIFTESDDGSANVRPGPVLYFTAENGIEEEMRRCALLRAGLGLPDDVPITMVAAETLSLSDDEQYPRVKSLVEEIRPVLIVVDSAIAVSGVDDESNNTRVRAFMQQRLTPIARTYRTAVYLLAHTGKPPIHPGARLTDEHLARGASDWRNAADAMIQLRRDPSLHPDAVIVRSAKIRAGKRPPPLWFRLEDIEQDKSLIVVYGGTYDEISGQGTDSELYQAAVVCVEILKATPAGLLMADVKPAGVKGATRRRALDVLRGKMAWPGGAYRGTKHAVVRESKRGRGVFFMFDAPAWRDADSARDASDDE